MFQLQAYSIRKMQSLQSVFLAPGEILASEFCFSLSVASPESSDTVLKKVFVLHCYCSHSSKASEEMTAVVQFPFSLGLHDQSIRRCFYFTQTDWIKHLQIHSLVHSSQLNGSQYFHPTSNKQQYLAPERACSFLFLLHTKLQRNQKYLCSLSISQLPSLTPLFFLFCLSVWYPKRKSFLVIKHQMPPTQPICHTSVSVLALTPTSILWGYLLVKHMTALKYTWDVSEATERTYTSLISFYPACKLVFKVDFLVVVKRRFADLILTSKEFADLFAFGISTRTEAGAWSQWWKRDVTNPGHTTSLGGWTLLLCPPQRGSSFMANITATEKATWTALPQSKMVLLKADL